MADKETLQAVAFRMALERACAEMGKDLDRQIKEADEALGGPRIGFALFLFTFEKDGALAYISNGKREDMVKLVREWLSKVDP